MKTIRTEDAVGQVLCHDVTRIAPGEKGVAFKKGHVVRPEDIGPLLDIGKGTLYVWEAEPDVLHEDDAARALYDLCAGPNMHAEARGEGRIDAVAEVDGLFTVDVGRLSAVNALGELIIATRGTNAPVRAGDELAGMRVIPLMIRKGRLDAARAVAGGAPLFSLAPFRRVRAGVVVTGGEVFAGRVPDRFTPVLERKLAEYGGAVAMREVLPDEPEPIARAIRKMAGAGVDMVLATGGMSVDPDDRTPQAIKSAGADMIRYGAPVLPGSMFLLAYLGGVPVLGLPGCVMHAGRTAFDLVLPRLLAGRRVTEEELTALGHGGLCLGCGACVFPNCGFGRGV